MVSRQRFNQFQDCNHCGPLLWVHNTTSTSNFGDEVLGSRGPDAFAGWAPRDLATSAWALATAAVQGSWPDAVVAALGAADLGGFTTRDLATLAWALAVRVGRLRAMCIPTSRAPTALPGACSDIQQRGARNAHHYSTL